MAACRSLLTVLLLWAIAAHAVIETYAFSSPELEQRYHRLSQELRCPKCQNQNIADSNAPISEDLRRLLYRQLEDGATDDEILDDMVGRYGEFVRYRPSFDRATALLWLAPLIFLFGGVLIAVAILRRSVGDRGSSHLDVDDQARLDALVSQADGEP